MLTYSCSYCLVAGRALTCWDAKTPSASKGHRWGCLNCLGNWDREHSAAVAFNLVMDGKSCSFYSYWPLSEWVKRHWPEVYHKASYWVMERTTWYSKYDGFPELRDEPPADDPKSRLRCYDCEM